MRWPARSRHPRLPHETLVIHGRDDKVIPLSNVADPGAVDPPLATARVRPLRPLDADRTQRRAFNQLVGNFLAEADAAN
jgi:2-hydroxymuconate-semialdehyde hydrolase